MRLLSVESFELKEFLESEVPPYAILSHTWTQDEVSYQDMQDIRRAKKRAAFQKIEYMSKQAKIDGLEWGWIDTCCIDKSSSADLQQAINSMYRWYAQAQVCYAYLADFPQHQGQSGSPAPYKLADIGPSELTESRWFRRGWTLQELVAPKIVRFYTSDWKFFGDKASHSHIIASATNIDNAILQNKRTPFSVSVAKRMSWAAYRATSRVEDQAYCLLGLFGVSIPMLYGEGPQAFTRLQEEIIRISNDQSIFAWDITLPNGCDGSLFAKSPSAFAACNSVVSWGRPGRRTEEEYYGVLNCHYEDDYRGALALRLQRINVESSEEYALSTNSCRLAFMDDPQAGVIGSARSGTDNDQQTFTEVRISERLAFLELSTLNSSTNSLIYIALSHDAVQTEPKFWFRLNLARHSSREDVSVVNRYPGHAWNLETSIMHIDNAADDDLAVSAVLLKSTVTGRHAILLFTYDRVGEYDDTVAEQLQFPAFRTIPSLQAHAIPLTASPEGFSFKQHLKQLRLSGGCEHHLGLCKNFTEDGRCAATASYQQLAWETDAGIEELNATISKASVMGQELVIVDAHMRCLPFELDSRPTERIFELEGPNAEETVMTVRKQRGVKALSEYPLKAYLDAWKLNVQFGEDARETLGRDGELAAAVAMTDTVTLLPGLNELAGTADVSEGLISPQRFEDEPASATLKEPSLMPDVSSTSQASQWDELRIFRQLPWPFWKSSNGLSI